ncbi:MAG: hypothetical protein NVSMB14_17240 [Isosphaeraceae bacterium]
MVYTRKRSNILPKICALRPGYARTLFGLTSETFARRTPA